MLRVGVVGLGKIGKLHFMNALRMSGVEVVAAADTLKINRKLAEECRVKTYDDYTKLFNSENLDAVIISLPNFLKKESITYASEKGLDIFVDKPLARNLNEAGEIVQTIRAHNVKLMVGANYRYFDSVQKLKKTLDEGSLGDIVIATSELIMDGPFSHSIVPKPVPEWWFDKGKSGGGTLLDLGYHLIDIFHWMFGDLEVEFSTLGYRFSLPVEDSVIVVLKSPKNGVKCIVNAGWFYKAIFPDFNFRINLHGTAGFLSTDRFAPRNLYLHAVKEGTLNLLRKIIGKRIHILSYTYYYASFAIILNQFFESIRQDEQPPISLEEQLTVIKTIDNAYESFREGNVPYG